MKQWTKCIIEGHYYKIDVVNPEIDPKLPEDKYYVKCQRCNNRILIHDKCYYARKEGIYKL